IFKRAEVHFVLGVLQNVSALSSEYGSIAGYAGGEYAIEHIHAARNEFDELCRRAQSHGVTRFVGGKEWLGELDGFELSRFGFTDAHAADGVAVEFQRNESFGAFFAQGGIRAALNDAEDQLAGRARLLAAFSGPANGAFDRQLLFASGSIVRRAFI